MDLPLGYAVVSYLLDYLTFGNSVEGYVVLSSGLLR
jgi:hypothetical protein